MGGGGETRVFYEGSGAFYPPKMGPAGLGTLTGESGVKFQVFLHPPEVGRLEFDNFLPKNDFWQMLMLLGVASSVAQYIQSTVSPLST